MIDVAAAIIIEDENILICQRQEGGSCGYLWEFPGGKRELNESLEQCLIRECSEELGITVSVMDVFTQTIYDYPESISLTFFHAKILDGVAKARIHKEIKWVSLKDLSQYHFCPADSEIIFLLQKN